MRALFVTAVLFISQSLFAQYYYKDIIGTKESSVLVQSYITNKVNRVVLTSYDADNTKSDNFFVEQTFSPARRTLTTITRTNDGNTSTLISYVDANGNVVRTVDSSDAVVSQTTYNYNSAGQLLSLVTASADSNATNESEQHIWEYQNNKPVRMLRIKNKIDTTFVNFKQDEKGNISEESETRRGVTTQPVYYYYNSNNQLTDIVRYSNRAKRLLPEYMFEYSSTGQVIQKITVPENSTDYLIWRYQFDTRGLKTKEVIYNKQKQVTGKVEYQYSFGA
jgi:hypothetical protein